MSAKVWVTGAGKGGVGKTFITSCLGITLTKMNSTVLLIDFDLTGANLHTNFGLTLTNKNLFNYVSGQEKFADLIQPTNVPKLSYIQGTWDSWVMPDLSVKKVSHVIEEARKLPFDYVIIDLGPGALPTHLEFFKLADQKMLITDPEPTSVEKTYRFLEAYICHSLRENMSDEVFAKLITTLKNYRQIHPKGHFSFRKYLSEQTGLNFGFFDEINRNPVRLIVNETRSRQDQDLGYSIKSVCRKYFDFSIDYLGFVDFDNAVWQSVRGKEPVLIEKPFTPLAGEFLNICRNLVNPEIHSNLFKAVI